MRYGIMEIQLESFIQPGTSPLKMIQAVRGFNHARLVKQIASHGFDIIELSGDLAMLDPAAYSTESIEQLLTVKQEYALSYTVHLPFWSLELASPRREVRQAAVEAVVASIRETQPLEPEVYVLHATGKMAAEFARMEIASLARPHVLKHFRNHARDSIAAVLERTGLDPRRLAIENIDFPFGLMLEVAEELDTAFCLDVGHALAGYSGGVDVFDALEECLPRLAEVHLHDSPWQGPQQIVQHGRDHQPLGRGDLDVGRFIQRLEATHFTGPVIFELTIQEAYESLTYISEHVRPQLLAT